MRGSLHLGTPVFKVARGFIGHDFTQVGVPWRMNGSLLIYSNYPGTTLFTTVPYWQYGVLQGKLRGSSPQSSRLWSTGLDRLLLVSGPVSQSDNLSKGNQWKEEKEEKRRKERRERAVESRHGIGLYIGNQYYRVGVVYRVLYRYLPTYLYTSSAVILPIYSSISLVYSSCSIMFIMFIMFIISIMLYRNHVHHIHHILSPS